MTKNEEENPLCIDADIVWILAKKDNWVGRAGAGKSKRRNVLLIWFLCLQQEQDIGNPS